MVPETKQTESPDGFVKFLAWMFGVDKSPMLRQEYDWFCKSYKYKIPIAGIVPLTLSVDARSHHFIVVWSLTNRIRMS